MQRTSIHLSLLLFLLLFSCSNNGQVIAIPYHINKPDNSYKLPKELIEISGLSYAENNQIYCIEDENGKVYVFDLLQKKVTKKIHFGKKSDYEGISLVDSTIYTVNSKGDLFQIKVFKNKNTTKKINTFLTKEHNIEGLCFDSLNNRLLLTGKGNSLDKEKYIFAYDLAQKKLLKEPIFSINIEEIQNSYGEASSFFGENMLSFNPSGIAIHPISKEIYILSARGNKLFILFNSGKIKTSVKLKKSIFKQPEGITFSPNGTLYISNEGRKGKANIKSFTYYPNL